MLSRMTLIVLVALAIGSIYFFNWEAMNTVSTISIGFTTMQAPMGILLLALFGVLCVLFLAYILWLHSTVIVDYHRHTKELKHQRELADKEEASRFNELREFLVKQHTEGQQALLRQMEELEDHIYRRVDDSDNSTAAYIGQIEDQLRQTGTTPQLGLSAPSPEPDRA